MKLNSHFVTEGIRETMLEVGVEVGIPMLIYGISLKCLNVRNLSISMARTSFFPQPRDSLGVSFFYYVSGGGTIGDDLKIRIK